MEPETQPASPAPETPASPDVCLNCGAQRIGEFCHDCGQHFLDGRLTLRRLWDDFAVRFFKMERGLLLTLRVMLLNPGRVIRHYVDGQRRRYVNPFTYLFFGAALSLLSFTLLKDAFLAWTQQTMAEAAAQAPTLLSPEQATAFVELNAQVTQGTVYTMLATAIPFSLLLCLFFRKQQINVAEAFVFALFSFGHVAFMNSVLTPTLYFLTADLAFHAYLTLGLYVFVCGYGALHFFERRFGSVVKVLLAFGLAYGLIAVLIALALLVFVMAFA